MTGAFVVSFSYAAAGHASTDEWPMVTLSLAVVHVGAMLLWLGGVGFWLVWVVAYSRAVAVSTALQAARGGAAAPTTPGHPTQRELAAFSRVATWSVLCVLVSGLALAWRFTDAFTLELRSFYGLLLTLKVVLVLVALLCAVRSHQAWSAEGLDAPADRALLVRAIRAEVVVGLLVVGAGSWLSSAALPAG